MLETKMPALPPVEDPANVKPLRKSRQKNYDALYKRLVARLNKATALLAKGESVAEWERFVTACLEDAHRQSSRLGRALSGDRVRQSQLDTLLWQEAARHDAPYFQRFVAQIKNGEYTDEGGGYKTDAINNRLNLYANRTRGTANKAFVLSSPLEAVFEWVMLGVEDHCSECPSRAEEGPYTVAQLQNTGYPGDGRTPCRSNCRCVLIRKDGAIGFARALDPEPDLKPSDVTPEDVLGDLLLPSDYSGDFFAV